MIQVIAMKMLVCDACWGCKRAVDGPTIATKREEQLRDTVAWGVESVWQPTKLQREDLAKMSEMLCEEPYGTPPKD